MFEVQKVILLIKNALWQYSDLCFFCWRGAQFQKSLEKAKRRVEREKKAKLREEKKRLKDQVEDTTSQ